MVRYIGATKKNGGEVMFNVEHIRKVEEVEATARDEGGTLIDGVHVSVPFERVAAALSAYAADDAPQVCKSAQLHTDTETGTDSPA